MRVRFFGVPEMAWSTRTLFAVLTFWVLSTVELQAGIVVGWWNFDDGTATDLSGNGHDGTLVGADVSFVNDPIRGQVLRVGGDGNYVRLASPTSSDLPDGYSERTMVGWGKLDVASGSYAWIASYGTPSFENSMFLGRAGGVTAFGGGFQSDVTQPGFWDTEWHFLALTYAHDGVNGTATFYGDWNGANGFKKTENRNWFLTRRNAFLGKQTFDEPNAFESWDGLIDDVAIFNKALPEKDIISIFVNGLDVFLAPAAVPEPSSLVLFAIGACFAGICVYRRRKPQRVA